MVGFTPGAESRRRITAGSAPIARASAAFESPADSRASSSWLTSASIVAIRADSVANSRADPHRIAGFFSQER